MGKVSFMTTGNNHCCAIAVTNVGKRNEDINLPTHEVTSVVAELSTLHSIACARMQGYGSTSTPNIHKILVNE